MNTSRRLNIEYTEIISQID